jgi:hypothetical protein
VEEEGEEGGRELVTTMVPVRLDDGGRAAPATGAAAAQRCGRRSIMVMVME